MSIAPTMEVWSQAHAKSDASEHHDAMRMFYAVEANLIEEAEAAPASNNKIKLITAKLLKQVTAELKAYTELMEGNYYVALGVSTSASSSEVKKAYRKLAMKHHPDKAVAGGCPGADKIFPMIQNAYECLSDPSTRKKYRPQVDLRTSLMKVRAAGKNSTPSSSSSSSSASNENSSYKSNNASHKYPYSRPPKQQQPRTQPSSSSSRSNYTENRSYSNHREKKSQAEQPNPQQKYYSNWKDQWAAEQAAKEKEQEERRKKNQNTYDDYYYHQQQKWERKKQEEESEAFKKRMAEIQKKKKEAEERRKRKEAEAKAEAARRKAERAEREAQFRKQREDEERVSKLKKIAKLPELREMKAKEIKERLKILGHTVIGCIEKEDFVKKYCVVTGQLYKPVVVANSRSGLEDDGSYFAFEDKIRAMSVKELTSFIKDRNGDVANLLEKSEIIDAALLLYRGVESGGVKKAMGRTQFAFHGFEDEDDGREEEGKNDFEEKEEEKEREKKTSPSKPVISTERMRKYETKFGKGNKTGETRKESKSATGVDDDESGVTLEDVVSAYRKRMGRTAFGRAGLNVDVNSDKEKEEEEEEEDQQQGLTTPRSDEPETPRSDVTETPRQESPKPMSKDDLKKVYEDMYKMKPGFGEEGKLESESKNGDNNGENTSPAVDTKWENTTRGKDFLVNGMKWDKEEIESSSESSEGVEWEPIKTNATRRPLPKHTVNLTPAEAAFIARQQLQRDGLMGGGVEVDAGEEGEGEGGDYEIDEESWERINQLNATLPNFTIREEVNFWLHGSQEGISEADYLAGESEEEVEDEDDGIDWKVELGEEEDGEGGELEEEYDDDLSDDFSDDGIEDVTPKVNQYWGQQRK